MGISPGASDIAVFEEQHIHHKLIRIFSDTAIFATCLATPYAVLESILSTPPEDTTLLYFLSF